MNAVVAVLPAALGTREPGASGSTIKGWKSVPRCHRASPGYGPPPGPPTSMGSGLSRFGLRDPLS